MSYVTTSASSETLCGNSRGWVARDGSARFHRFREVLALSPDGIFLSNGPGDPASMNKEVEEIKRITGRKTSDVWNLFWAPVAGPRLWR